MILEHEVVGVAPVVGDLAGIVIAHDVDAVGVGGLGAWAAEGVVRAAALALLRLGHEPVHPPAIDVGGGVRGTVRATVVEVGGVMERLDAAPVHGVGHAHAGWDPVGAGIRPEILIERPVLLHDHDDVLDLVDPGQIRHGQHRRVRPDVPGVAAEHRPERLRAALRERDRGVVARAPVKARPRDDPPPVPDPLFDQDLRAPMRRLHRAGEAGRHPGVDRRGRAGERDRGRTRSETSLLRRPAGGHVPLAIGLHGPRPARDREPAGAVGRGPAHPVKHSLSGGPLPQRHLGTPRRSTGQASRQHDPLARPRRVRARAERERPAAGSRRRAL